MKLVPFDSNKTDQEYRKIYNQYGAGSIPIFTGTKTQVGYGLGGMFGNLLKAALPVIKKGAISLGKTALKTGLNIAKDKIGGKNIKKAISDNLKEAGKDVLSNSLNNISGIFSQTKQSHQPNKRKRQRVNQSISKKSAKRRRTNKAKQSKDIFN